jgi:hypothetical protein
MKRKRLSLIGLVLIGITVLGLGGCAAIMDLFTSPTIFGTITWEKAAHLYRGEDYLRYTFTLPAGGAANSAWGTGIYRDTSSIGTAAVHAGLITFAVGGTVTIRILPGQSSYTGTTAYEVTSLDASDGEGSFEFVTK